MMSNDSDRDSDSDEERVTETDALADSGTRYRTLVANKSGESSDDDS